MATEITDHYRQSRYPGSFHREIYRATIDTDANGDGTLSISLDGYGATPVVQVTSDVGSAANVTANGFDVEISGGPANSTVDVEALVDGPPGVA